MMDIDHFKSINDNYGHDAGDRVLVEMAHALSSHFNDVLVARLGGEEFCVMFDGMGTEEARTRIEDFRADIQNSVIEIGEDLINFTLSVGVTDTHGESLELMIKDADTLLYEAKNSGRNMVVTNLG
jgi:diguanylate cyclase (GGDEF)-like protein